MISYFRFLYRNKLYTLINVLGLAISMMFVILIGDYTWRQFSVDSWHKNKDRIFLLGNDENFYSWPSATQEIGAMYPEIEKTCCVMSQSGNIKYGWNYYIGSVYQTESANATIMLADPTFFDFFDFKITKGDGQAALSSPDKCVITESLAEYFFNDADPIGKPLNIIGDRLIMMSTEDPYDTTFTYTVAAVIKDFDRTIFPNRTKIIVSMERQPQIFGYEYKNSMSSSGLFGGVSSFLMIKDGYDLSPKLTSIHEYLDKNVEAVKYINSKEATLTPLDEIMFAPQNHGKGMLKGDKSRINILLTIVIAILVFAVMNYINLTTANTGFRAREMATRRLLGSRASSIFITLIAESTLMVLVAFLIGFFFAYNLQDEFMSLFKGKICLANDLNINTICISIAFILFTGIISGVIPSIQIMKFKPIDVVKGSFRYNSKMVMSRIFIIIQNVITVTMLTATLVIIKQINHLVNAPLGVNIKDTYYVWRDENDGNVVRDALASLPCIEKIGVISGSNLVGGSKAVMTMKDNDGKYHEFYRTAMDSVALNILGLDILKDYGNSDGAIYLNEEAMRLLNPNESEKTVTINGEQVAIAGVIADFRTVNILKEIVPYVVFIEKAGDIQYFRYIVKTDGSNDAVKRIADAMFESTDGKYDESMINDPSEFVLESFKNERNTLKIVVLFTIIAAIISVLGLLGISVFFLRQRKNEIGLRRIMGSTVKEVTVLILSKFCAPLLVSFALAVPLSYFIMSEWLKGFSYRISLSPWIFLSAIAFSLLIAVFSVFFQTWKAANANPVESLKKE